MGQSLLPGQCGPADGCICYGSEALAKIAKELTFAKLCRYEVEQLRAYAERGAEPVEHNIEWYQEPQMIVGGLVVTVSLGLMVGLALGKK